VRQKVLRVGGFLEELDAKAGRYQHVADEIHRTTAPRR
jgi:hypothetical protein